jgi:hypothetical protein
MKLKLNEMRLCVLWGASSAVSNTQAHGAASKQSPRAGCGKTPLFRLMI